MIIYKLVPTGGVLKLLDGVVVAFVPNNTANADWQEYLRWSATNNPLPADAPPAPSQDQLDIAAVCAYQKLVTLSNMSPTQITAWITANVTNLAGAQDAINTLAIGMSVLVRQFIRGNKQ